jgi:predicted ester cyclase
VIRTEAAGEQDKARMKSLNLPSVIEAYVESFNGGDFPRLMSLFTPDALIFGVLGSAPIAQAQQVWRELHEGMQMHLEPEAVAVDGTTAVVRYIESGCFHGKFRGLPETEPTGRLYRVTAIEWFELRGERIAKRWGSRDFDAIKRQVLEQA